MRCQWARHSMHCCLHSLKNWVEILLHFLGRADWVDEFGHFFKVSSVDGIYPVTLMETLTFALGLQWLSCILVEPTGCSTRADERCLEGYCARSADPGIIKVHRQQWLSVYCTKNSWLCRMSVKSRDDWKWQFRLGEWPGRHQRGLAMFLIG